MRKTHKITDQEANPRWESMFQTKNAGERPRFVVFRQNYIEPEPVGTIVLVPFRIIGYAPDCDGSAMAEMENLYIWNNLLSPSGWDVSHVGIDDCLVVDEDELLTLLGVDVEGGAETES